MSDTQAAMRAFRFLDDKRNAGGLSAAEEQRWNELRQQLGIPDAPQQAYAEPQGYYASDGNWYPYPEGYDPAQYAQQGYDRADPNNSGWAGPQQSAADLLSLGAEDGRGVPAEAAPTYAPEPGGAYETGLDPAQAYAAESPQDPGL